MSYYATCKEVKETTQNKTVAVASYKEGAEIIVNALNFYFGVYGLTILILKN